MGKSTINSIQPRPRNGQRAKTNAKGVPVSMAAAVLLALVSKLSRSAAAAWGSRSRAGKLACTPLNNKASTGRPRISTSNKPGRISSQVDAFRESGFIVQRKDYS